MRKNKQKQTCKTGKRGEKKGEKHTKLGKYRERTGERKVKKTSATKREVRLKTFV